jgi:hypothetical protein
VITEDEVMRLLERADPARSGYTVPVVDAAGYLATLRTRSTTVTLIDTEPTPTRPNRHHHWPIIAVAAAAVVAIVVGGLALATRDDDPNEQIPAATTVTPDTATAAEEVATGFFEARNAYDADRALAYLGDEYVAAEHGTAEQYRLSVSFSEAVSDKTVNLDCEQQGESAAGIVVRCTYDYHSFRSDEIGLGPYTGDYQDFTIRDGSIIAVEANYEGLTSGFSDQMWEPFRRWVSAEHPDDVPVMYEGFGWRITEESIPLWEQRLREYVASGAAYTERGFTGLPPESATPSTPERGELVDEFSLRRGDYHYAGAARLYADGRLIWRMNDGNGPPTPGWLEQRLTPEAVQLVRDHVILGHGPGGEQREMEVATLLRHEWLPPSAWEDQWFRRYVPSRYGVCLNVLDPNPAGPISTAQPPIEQLPVEQLVGLLPAPAADLLRGRQAVEYSDPGTPRQVWDHCLGLTTDEARQLDRALSDAGFEPDEQLNDYLLGYHVDYPGRDDEHIEIMFEPMFPDGTISSSAGG